MDTDEVRSRALLAEGFATEPDDAAVRAKPDVAVTGRPRNGFESHAGFSSPSYVLQLTNDASDPIRVEYAERRDPTPRSLSTTRCWV